jgi:hypothetical protein
MAHSLAKWSSSMIVASGDSHRSYKILNCDRSWGEPDSRAPFFDPLLISKRSSIPSLAHDGVFLGFQFIDFYSPRVLYEVDATVSLGEEKKR